MFIAEFTVVVAVLILTAAGAIADPRRDWRAIGSGPRRSIVVFKMHISWIGTVSAYTKCV